MTLDAKQQLAPAEATRWLDGRINHERAPSYRGARLSLAPIQALLARIGDPHRKLRVLHVAGSKGKGSVALLAEGLLRGLGLKTAVYTSPHLRHWSERFRVEGVPADAGALAEAVSEIRPHAEALDAGPDGPTWFDVATAAALWLFARAEPDVCILEVGLGGRLDSTNVVDPALCCITTIELEHTDRLGTTLGEIAAEKAGILKPGVPAVVGPLPAEAMAVVEARADAVGAPLTRLGRELRLQVLDEGLDGTRFRLRDGAVDFEARVGALGSHQATNAALAAACVVRIASRAPGELAEAAGRVLPRAQLPGRIEVLSRRPFVVVDAAHTAASARALARVLAQVPRTRAHLVLSVSAGKDLDAICQALAAHFDRITITRAEPVRSLTVPRVDEALRRLAPQAVVRVVPNAHLALHAARESAAPGDLVCATGSIYLAGIAREVLGSGADPEAVVSG